MTDPSSGSTGDDLLRARAPAGGPAVMLQSWRRLLFLHWKTDLAPLRTLLPDGLEIDTFEGAAYLGIVPFFMCGVRPRFLPPVPCLSNFLELNVRTYVRPVGGGPPGVWFFSLDANCRPAVWAARKFFHLPYFHAEMKAEQSGGWTDYRSRRREGPVEEKKESHYRYRPRPESPPPREAEPGTLEFFLLERYWLYAHNPKKKQLYKGQVAHRPYRYQKAEVPRWDPTPTKNLPQSLQPNGPPAHQCVAEDVSVRIFGIERA